MKRNESGQAVIAGIAILILSGIVCLGVVLIRDAMNQQRRGLRIQIARNSLVQQLNYVLKNPLTYQDFATLSLSAENLSHLTNINHKIAGLPCGASGDECKIEVRNLNANPVTRTMTYDVAYVGSKPAVKIQNYSVTVPAATALSNKSCPAATPILERIDASGNPVCRGLTANICPAGEFLVGIRPNLSAECAQAQDQLLGVPANQYIKSYAWVRNSNSFTLSPVGADREVIATQPEATSFQLGPVSFFPRPGTDISGPTVDNIYWPRKDSVLFKCPTEYPVINFVSATGNVGISCSDNALNESTRVYICAYPKGDNRRLEVKLTYECSKKI